MIDKEFFKKRNTDTEDKAIISVIKEKKGVQVVLQGRRTEVFSALGLICAKVIEKSGISEKEFFDILKMSIMAKNLTDIIMEGIRNERENIADGGAQHKG